MNPIIRVEDIKNFIPCQGQLQISEPLLKIEHEVDHLFSAQETNMNYILSNNLSNAEKLKMKNSPNIPEFAKEAIYNGVASKQFEVEVRDLKSNKFNIKHDEVEISAPKENQEKLFIR